MGNGYEARIACCCRCKKYTSLEVVFVARFKLNNINIIDIYTDK